MRWKNIPLACDQLKTSNLSLPPECHTSYKVWLFILVSLWCLWTHPGLRRKECLATPLDLIVALCAFFTLCSCFPTKISHLLILHFSYLNVRSPAQKCISGMRPYGNNLCKFIDPLHGCIKVKKKGFWISSFCCHFLCKKFQFSFSRKKKEFGKFHQNTRIMFDANASLKCSNNARIVCKKPYCIDTQDTTTKCAEYHELIPLPQPSLQFQSAFYNKSHYLVHSLFSWFSFMLKCPNFSVQLCLPTRGKLMLANFRLKIRPFWDSDLKNWYSNFSGK